MITHSTRHFEPQNQCAGESPIDSAIRFLAALWPEPPPSAWLLIWLKAGKRSLWFRAGAWGEAASVARIHADRTDVYVGCGLSPHDNGPTKRCEANDIIAIPGLWADVDIQGEAHKSTRLPPDTESALALIADMPRPASAIVHSGHGLQPWCLFDRPWVLNSEEDRQHAARLLADWQGHLRKLASVRGWNLDATHDLARVLRLPGTTNRKAEPLPVTLDLQEPVRRYTVAELEAAIPKTIPLTRKSSLTATATTQDDRAIALSALAGLNASRAVNYDSWLAVGMALHSVDSSSSMCDEWDRWSRLSLENYQQDACAAKWKTFDDSGGLTIGSLIHWAKSDGWNPPGSRPTSPPPEPAPPPIEPAVAAEQLTYAVLETLRTRPPLARTLSEILRGIDREGEACA